SRSRSALFSVHAACVPSALLSFPTRRSSDLWLLAFPGVQPWLAATVLGFGLGGGFALALVLIVDYAGDADGSSRLAALVFFLGRSEEHTSELQSRENLVCRLLLEKKKLIHRF